MLRRPDMQTCPSAAINTWLAFTLLQTAAVSNSETTNAITAQRCTLPVHVAHVVDVFQRFEHAQ